MHMSSLHDYARQLLELYGDKAEAVAARKMRECQARGDDREADNWRRVWAAVKEMRTAHVS